MRTVRLALNEAEQAVAKARRAIAEMLGESGTAEGAPAKTPTRREKAARTNGSKAKKGASTATKTETSSKTTATAGKSSPKTSNGANWTVEEMMPKLLRVMNLEVGLSRKQISERIGIDHQVKLYAFDKALSNLKERGVVRMEGERRNSRYFLVKAPASVAPGAESPASAN